MVGTPSFTSLLLLVHCAFGVKWSYFELPVYEMRGMYPIHEHPHFKEFHSYHYHINSLDLDLILASRRLVHYYVGCLIDTRPCNSEGDELKRILPEAIETKCAKCTERQKAGAKKVMRVLQERYPYEWHLLHQKWNLQQLKDTLEE